jgi:hypothetical protein
MHFQFEVSSPIAASGATAGATPAGSSTDLLQLMLDVQREQVQLLRQLAAAHDSAGRWKSFVSRWRDDYGELPAACKQVFPHLERAYIALIADLTESLRQQDERPLDNEFALSEFLDRYGMRLSQLAGLLSLVGPLADLAPAPEESK